jgi:hypothetical protein
MEQDFRGDRLAGHGLRVRAQGIILGCTETLQPGRVQAAEPVADQLVGLLVGRALEQQVLAPLAEEVRVARCGADERAAGAPQDGLGGDVVDGVAASRRLRVGRPARRG